MKRLFNFKYQKTILLLVSIVLAYFLFSNSNVVNVTNSFINATGYTGAFFAGIFFSFGFSAPIATGFFLTSTFPDITIAAAMGGVGAFVGDLIIFNIIRLSFMDEFNRLKNIPTFKRTRQATLDKLPAKIKLYLLYAFAGIVISSPLPDEFGVTMLAGLTDIKPQIFSTISFVLNTLGILIILLI